MTHRVFLENLEVVDHAGRDQQPEDHEEFALRPEVGLAGFPNRVGNVCHALMCRQGLGLRVLHEAEHRAEHAYDEAEIHQRGAAHAAQSVEFYHRQVRDFDVGLAAKSRGDAAEDRQQKEEPEFALQHNGLGLLETDCLVAKDPSGLCTASNSERRRACQAHSDPMARDEGQG